MLLRMLREPGTGRPAPFTRLLVLIVAAALLGTACIPLLLGLRWVVSLL